MLRVLTPVLILLLFSCRNNKLPLVDNTEVDQLISKASDTAISSQLNAELAFWKNRMDDSPGGFVNEEKYAYALEAQFHNSGNIYHLLSADSLLTVLNKKSKEGDAGILRSLGRIAISRHQFDRADTLIQKALALGSEKYNSTLMQFDAAFELAHYNWAGQLLKKLQSTNDYGYFFRKARWQHYEAAHDSSVVAMTQALQLAEGNNALMAAALSNLGDLYLHNSDSRNALKSYQECLAISPGDIHSLSGIGSIALLHDGNDSIAEKIFMFCSQQTMAPDPLLKMIWIAEHRGDTKALQQYARSFVSKATKTTYGNMYNKYLVDIYTGSLKNPAMAVAIAQKEIELRPSPQSFSWYAWSLFKNGEAAKANNIFEKEVSGKPLEALELYYMGMMLEETGRKSLSKRYLASAQKNKYDLSPAKLRYIDELLNK